MSVANFSETSASFSMIPNMIAYDVMNHPEDRSKRIGVIQVQEKSLPYLVGERVIAPMISIASKVFQHAHSLFSAIDKSFSFPVVQANPLVAYAVPVLGSLEIANRLSMLSEGFGSFRPYTPPNNQMAPFPAMPSLNLIPTGPSQDQLQSLQESRRSVGLAQASLANIETQLIQSHKKANDDYNDALKIVSKQEEVLSEDIRCAIQDNLKFQAQLNQQRLISLGKLGKAIDTRLEENSQSNQESRELRNIILKLSDAEFAVKGAALIDLYKNQKAWDPNVFKDFQEEENTRFQNANNSFESVKASIEKLSNERSDAFKNFQTKVQSIKDITESRHKQLMDVYKIVMEREKVLFDGYLKLREAISKEQDTDFKNKLLDRQQLIEQYIAMSKQYLEIQKTLREETRKDLELRNTHNKEKANELGNLLKDVISGPGQIFKF